MTISADGTKLGFRGAILSRLLMTAQTERVRILKRQRFHVLQSVQQGMVVHPALVDATEPVLLRAAGRVVFDAQTGGARVPGRDPFSFTKTEGEVLWTETEVVTV